MPFEPGQPVPEGTIPLSVPEIRGNEWTYIKECLDEGWVSSVGKFVDRFEECLSECVGTQNAVATVNGTTALHTALLASGIRQEEEVLVSTLTFIAPANAIRYVGAWPVFMDAEHAFWQMDPQKVWDFLNKECRWVRGELRNKRTNRRVKAILPVHILGHPVDMDPILEAARKYDLKVIEDASEGLGAKYRGHMVGSLADAACFSFNGNKIITTGGGGMVVTDNKALARRARYLSTQAKDDSLEYVHNEIGYNYRLTNIQAAMGCAQMEQLDAYIAAKRRIASAYTEALKAVPGITPMEEAPWAHSTFWLYSILVDEERYGMDSRALLERLSKKKVISRPLWQPLHLSPAHCRSQAYAIERAEKIQRLALSLPCSVGLGPDDLNRVATLIRDWAPN